MRFEIIFVFCFILKGFHEQPWYRQRVCKKICYYIPFANFKFQWIHFWGTPCKFTIIVEYVLKLICRILLIIYEGKLHLFYFDESVMNGINQFKWLMVTCDWLVGLKFVNEIKELMLKGILWDRWRSLPSIRIFSPHMLILFTEMHF